ncbi:hypothetical protein [Kitasatospora sp. NPDC057223]|uniref:hypothetical protein n=1 Tax=Kitasatospora sp. NPDC057223 TaxID=3346055 RepID=UPI003645DC9E
MKDEQSFADKTGHPAYWTGEQAVAIRAEGALPARRAQAREFPFDDPVVRLPPARRVADTASAVTSRLPVPRYGCCRHPVEIRW